MTTIVTKNGSGAPLASDLVQGELAVDLTNKRLYTEDSGGTVIEVGTSPSTIDINAGTIDGTVIGGASAAAGTFTTFTSTGIDDNATSTAITIDASENVGIGTATPGALLEINQNAENVVRIRSADGTIAGILFGDQSDLSRGSVYYDNSNESMQFRVNDQSEAMRIDSSGNVGIGTSSPSKELHVKASADTSGDTIIGLSPTTTDNIQGGLGCIAGGELQVIGTNQTSFLTAGAERMRIDSSGNLLVGTTTITSATDTRSEIRSGSFSEIALQLSTTYNGGSNKSMVYFVDGGNDLCGNIYINASSNTTAYSTSSDERLKENITDANSSGSLIDQLKVRQFDWKNSNVHQDYGFIAQELYEKVPIAVYRPETGSGDYDESGTWGVDYSKLVPMLVKEIQDLRARVAQLEEA